MTEYNIILSTTEPNNNVGIVKLRHADVNSQAIVAQIVENGQPKNFEGLQPYFCLMAQEITGQGVSEESIVSFDAKKGTLTYTASDNALQFVGRNEAYFSFRKQVGDQWIEQFSTRTFNYIVEKSIYSQPFKDSNYWWTFKELYRIFNQYIENGKDNWEQFVNQNKEILESVDPGGKILSELLAARNGEANLKARLDKEHTEVTAQLAQTNILMGKIDLTSFLIETDNDLKLALTNLFNVSQVLNTNIEIRLPESSEMKLSGTLTFPEGFNLIVHLPETSTINFINEKARILIESQVSIKGAGTIDCGFLNTNSAITVTENAIGSLSQLSVKRSLNNSIDIFGNAVVDGVTVSDMNSVNNLDKYAINVNSKKRVSIVNNKVHDIFGSGIYVTGQYTLKNNCFVNGNTVYNIFAQSGTGQYGNGISLSSATDTLVTNNMVFDCNFTCIRAFSSKNIWIKENNINQNNGLSDDWGNGIFVEFTHVDTIVEANILNKCRIQIVNQHAESLDRGRTICANNIVKSGCILTEGAIVINGNIIDFNEEDRFKIGIGLGQGEVVFDVNCSDNYIYDSKATPTLILGVGVLNEIPVISDLRCKTMRNVVVSSNTIKNAKQNVGRISLNFAPVYQANTNILASPQEYAQVFGNGDDKTLDSFYRYTSTSTDNYFRVYVGRLRINYTSVAENRVLKIELNGGLNSEPFDRQIYYISNQNGNIDIKHIRYFSTGNKRHLFKVYSDGEYYYFTITPEGGEWTFTIESEYTGKLGDSTFEKIKCSRIDTSENNPFYGDYSLSNSYMSEVTSQVVTDGKIKTYSALATLA